MEQFIRSNPLGTAIGLLVLVAGILVLTVLASAISTYRVRKELKNKYLVYPEPEWVIANTIDSDQRPEDA